MAGIAYYLRSGPDTVTVSTSVTGGQLLEADPNNTGQARPASAGSTTWLGVAMNDAAPRSGTTGGGADLSQPAPNVAVHYGPTDVQGVTYAAAAAFGQPLVAAADGQITPYTPPGSTGANTYDQIVGRCTEPAGVTAGATGRVRLA